MACREVCRVLLCIAFLLIVIGLGVLICIALLSSVNEIFESCNEQWIPKDYNKLHRSLKKNLFGQHLVQDSVYRAVKGHAIHQLQKPLVLSFHGTTGTGKNHVSRLITQSWFRNGMESNYVHVLSAIKDFPLKSKLDEYKVQLQTFVKENTRSCQHSVFIFDEVDFFPPGLIDSVQSFLDYGDEIDGVDFRNTIFLLLSNTGTNSLKNITEDFYLKHKNREAIKLADAEEAIIEEVFSEETGLSSKHFISFRLISLFVPFLPLERSHVRECIAAELERIGAYNKIHMTEKVMTELQFQGPDNTFSRKGCKSVAEKVSYVIIGDDVREDL